MQIYFLENGGKQEISGTCLVQESSAVRKYEIYYILHINCQICQSNTQRRN